MGGWGNPTGEHKLELTPRANSSCMTTPSAHALRELTAGQKLISQLTDINNLIKIEARHFMILWFKLIYFFITQNYFHLPFLKCGLHLAIGRPLFRYLVLYTQSSYGCHMPKLRVKINGFWYNVQEEYNVEWVLFPKLNTTIHLL